jgi:hypothetical protein
MADLAILHEYGNPGEVLTVNSAGTGTEWAMNAVYRSATDPVVTDGAAKGFSKGSQWLNTTDNTMWMCLNPSDTAAVWRSVYRRDGSFLALIPVAGVGGTDGRALQADEAGDTRGVHAVDLQSSRSAGAAVAAGIYTVVGGGYDCLVSSSASYSTVAGGQASYTLGTHGSVGGGNGCGAEGDYSTVAGGSLNYADGDKSAIGGGASNAADGEYSTIPGGLGAVADKYGQMSFASGSFGTQGDAQTSMFVARRYTTTNFPTDLMLDGSSERLIIPANTTWAYKILLAAAAYTSTCAASWVMEGLIVNNNGTIRHAGAGSVGPDQSLDFDGGSIDPTVWRAEVIDDSGWGDMAIQVTGQASTNIRWVARVEIVEVTGTPPPP